MKVDADLLRDSRFIRRSRVASLFKKHPLGFTDIGSLGGVHPIVAGIANLVHAFCFEPDEAGYLALKQRYTPPKPFAGVTVLQDAIAGRNSANRALHVSVTPTNTSLLIPSEVFIDRYHGNKFLVEKEISVRTRTLDSIAYGRRTGFESLGEFIKLDTQGSEHEILLGSRRILKERCVAVFCEVEFFEVYKGQKTLADIVVLLRKHGFALYGLYPHYRSAGLLDRRKYETEERLMWADAIFFKDPFDSRSSLAGIKPRQSAALVLASLSTGYFDFALELARYFWGKSADTAMLEEVVTVLASAKLEATRRAFKNLVRQSKNNRDAGYSMMRQFIETQSSNQSTEHLWNIPGR